MKKDMDSRKKEASVSGFLLNGGNEPSNADGGEPKTGSFHPPKKKEKNDPVFRNSSKNYNHRKKRMRRKVELFRKGFGEKGGDGGRW